jgi:hypothetical protein
MQTEDLLVRFLAKANPVREFSNGVNIDLSTAGKIKEILSPDLNWAYFFEQARSEGVLSLIYKNLSEIDYAKSIVPGDVWERLESSYYTVAVHNTLLYEKLNNILNSFHEANIEIIILKGMDLAQTIYPDIALRPMYDIDILIHKKDFPLVEAKLRGLGYMNSPSYPEDFHKDNMMVDVHWDLMNITRVKSRSKSYRIDIDEIWKGSRLIEISGQKARILSPEHYLMHLCLHLTLHHGLSGLIWFIDIARLIEYHKNEIDWNRFVDDSFRYKIYKPIYYTLCYVKEILGQEIPQFVLDELKPKRQNFLEKKIFNLILSDASLENIRFFFTLSTMTSLLDKLIFLKEIALPSPKVLSAKYNIPSARYIPQYYAIHFKSILSSISKLLQKIS